MRRSAPGNMRRPMSGIAVMLLCALCARDVQAGGYPYRDYYPYDAHGYHERQRLRQDMHRLREELRRQHRRLEAQSRLQQEQTRLLRQQQSASQRVTAMQAWSFVKISLLLHRRSTPLAVKKSWRKIPAVPETSPGLRTAAEIEFPMSRTYSNF